MSTTNGKVRPSRKDEIPMTSLLIILSKAGCAKIEAEALEEFRYRLMREGLRVASRAVALARIRGSNLVTREDVLLAIHEVTIRDSRGDDT